MLLFRNVEFLSIPLEWESSHYQAFSHCDNVEHNVFYIMMV